MGTNGYLTVVKRKKRKTEEEADGSYLVKNGLVFEPHLFRIISSCLQLKFNTLMDLAKPIFLFLHNLAKSM
jgi:hypothetical protein